MKKQFIISLILVFIFGLTPINFSYAITQNQINAEVQIVCPFYVDGVLYTSSGSGTIIDAKGIILTNRHVVKDELGQIIKYCAVGLTKSFSQPPSFDYKAEVKYFTTSEDLDVAILYIDNKNNTSFPYINAFDYDTSSLKLGDGIEVIGYPSIGGDTLTYVTGVMSGRQGNYIKTTAPLEHGNSGGSAFTFSGDFIGIPTVVAAGPLNSLSYILDVNKIKDWLQTTLGGDYSNIIKLQPKPVIQNSIQLGKDITPPDTSGVTAQAYKSAQKNEYLQFNFNADVNTPYFEWKGFQDDSGVSGYYVYFGTDFNARPIDSGFFTKNNDFQADIKESGIYYLKIQAKDNNNNISNAVYWTYYYKNAIEVPYASNPAEDARAYYSRKSFENYPTKFYIYDYSNGYKGNLLEIVYFDMKKVKTISVPTNDVYIEWEQFNDTNFITSVMAILDKGRSKGGKYYAELILAPCAYLNKNFWESSNDDWYKCLDKEEAKYKKPVSQNYIIKEGLGINEQYGFEISTFFQDHRNTWPSLGGAFKIFTLIPESKKTQYNNNNLGSKLKGKILLQIESHGEAWYVNPKDGKRYYMANGEKAYNAMRNFGVGITNKDLEKIKTNKTFAKNNSGKIFLQVEAKGEAYYIDFNGNAHYLKDGSAAYAIMRELGLGITNNDLNKIPVGTL